MLEYTFSMIETLAVAIVLLIIGRWIKSKIFFFEKYFIPAPVIGGVIFSIFTLIGKNTGTFEFFFEGELKNLLMVTFFTTIGFLASFKLLKKGGIQVLIFLGVASGLVIIQNFVGIHLAKFFNLNPLLGIASGSIPLTGGHGTAGAFGPVLESAGATGAMSVAIASATFGLVAGCLIGGPVGKRLLLKYNLVGHKEEEFIVEGSSNKISHDKEIVTENSLFKSIVLIVISIGIGEIVNALAKKIGIILPTYIGPMLVAAVIRNIVDSKSGELPLHTINVIGNIALQLFLAMALMLLKLWELAALAVPLVVILLVQTLVMALYAYFITFRAMGKDYDAAVIATGHCGFGMGATPNAMANMESFTAANGPSPAAFFVLPLVGALFIDFVNASIITVFMNIFG